MNFLFSPDASANFQEMLIAFCVITGCFKLYVWYRSSRSSVF